MMSYLTELEIFLITCIPSLTSVISIITAVKIVINSLSQLKENKQIKAERDAFFELCNLELTESRKTRKQNALLIEKVTHVKYEDLSEVRNDEDLQV